jgi:hypothetical protein
MTNDTVPPTEPVTPAATAASVMPAPGVLPAKASRSRAPRAARAPRAKTGLSTKPVIVTGDKLIPDLNDHKEAMSEEVFFWIGLTMECPVENITIAGIRLSKTQERVVRSKSDPKKHDRFPVYGGIARMTRSRFDQFCEVMSRTVFRFHSTDPVIEEPGTGQNMGDVHTQARRGYPIQIPSAKLIAERKALGKGVRPYRASSLDEAAAYYVYARECQNQKRPQREQDQPATLDVTGIVWPGSN